MEVRGLLHICQARPGEVQQSVDAIGPVAPPDSLETARDMVHRCGVPALYSFISLTICLDDSQHVLMVREARADCRGKFYIPAGRGSPGEDPLAVAYRTTIEKTGLSTEPLGLLGIEHTPPIGQYPGQLRTIVLARSIGGTLKTQEDEHSMDALWLPTQVVRELKQLRSTDFLPWLEDAMLGLPYLPAANWRSLGSPR